MKRLKEILVSVGFFILILIPVVEIFLDVFPEGENHENRAMKGMPVLDSIDYNSFPSEFDEYYTDNYTLRNHLLRLNSKIKFNVFSIPPIEGKAFLGSDGWMYLVKDEMDIYLGYNNATDEELERYYDIFCYRRDYLDSIGSKYYIVFAPIKTSVYPEYIPLVKRKNNQKTLTDQLVEMLDTVSGIRVVDLRKSLIEAKGGTRLYHKTDNHWNEYGSFVGYQAIMNSIHEDFPQVNPMPLSDFVVDSVESNSMGLTNMMGIYDGVIEQYISCKQLTERRSDNAEKSNYPVPKWFPYKDSYESVYRVNNDSLPRLLLICDSFGKSVIPYLNEHFSKSTFIFDAWLHKLHEDIVVNEQPDIFVQLMVESLASNVHDNSKKP